MSIGRDMTLQEKLQNHVREVFEETFYLELNKSIERAKEKALQEARIWAGKLAVDLIEDKSFGLRINITVTLK